MEKTKELDRPWFKNEGIFLLTSFSFHMLMVSILLHLPLYPHQPSSPKIIEVKIIEVPKKVEKIEEAKQQIGPPAPLEKKVLKIKKIREPEEKIKAFDNYKLPPEKIILENFETAPNQDDVRLKEDNTWVSDRLIFPEDKKDAKLESKPSLSHDSNPAPVQNLVIANEGISEKAGHLPGLLDGGEGDNKRRAISSGGFWFGESSDRPGISIANQSGKVGGFLNSGESGHPGFSKISGKERDGGGNLALFLGLARKKIEGAKRYPPEALRRNWEGKVILSFLVNQQGEVKEIKIVQSSGYKVLDEEALATLRRASPLPVPPQTEGESLKIEVPILFRLD